MRITLNDRSTQQLLQIMDAYGFNSPTHAVQVMIGKIISNLEAAQHPTKSIPTSEDEPNANQHHQRHQLQE
jgi:hypothetical protein